MKEHETDSSTELYEQGRISNSERAGDETMQQYCIEKEIERGRLSENFHLESLEFAESLLIILATKSVQWLELREPSLGHYFSSQTDRFGSSTYSISRG